MPCDFVILKIVLSVCDFYTIRQRDIRDMRNVSDILLFLPMVLFLFFFDITESDKFIYDF